MVSISDIKTPTNIDNTTTTVTEVVVTTELTPTPTECKYETKTYTAYVPTKTNSTTITPSIVQTQNIVFTTTVTKSASVIATPNVTPTPTVTSTVVVKTNTTVVQNELFLKYKNDLILDNFLTKEIKCTSDLFRVDNKFLTEYNYRNYIEEIGLAEGEDSQFLRKKALEKFIEDFSSGNCFYLYAGTILRSIGVTNLLMKCSNSDYVIKFRYDDKNYTVKCNRKLARLTNDSLNIKTYARAELLKDFTETEIKVFFKTVSTENDIETRFILATDKYSSIIELKSNLYEEYRNSLILNNFLSDKHKTSPLSTSLYKTSNGQLLTRCNYSVLKEEIKLSTEEESEENKKRALEKFIKDFTEGNLANIHVRNILNVIEATNIKIQTTATDYVVNFDYDNTKYVLTCSKEAAKSANDSMIVETFSRGKL